MSRISRKKIRAALEGGRAYTVRVGDVQVSLRKLQHGYHLILKEEGDEPMTWYYRKEEIAFDRFEAKVGHLKRTQDRKENS